MSNDDKSTINFTPQLAKKLQKAYDLAVKQKQKTFMFEGYELVVGYVKYLLEYLKTIGVLR